MKARIKHKEILPIYVKGLYNHKYTLKQAAESTGYSIDHLCRLKKKYALLGNTLEELRPQNEQQLRMQIRDQINDDILSNSKIKDVKFIQLDVIKQ